MTLILSTQDAEELLPMGECIAALEEAYRELAHERAASAVRSDAVCTTTHPDAVYSLKLMGGVVPSLGVSAVRLNSDIITYGNQRQVKLPLAPGNRYTGLVLLFSTHTGEPLAIFPDGVLQRMRVGAASALGVKYLARPDATTVGLVGAGWQAGGQVMAITSMRKSDVIRCYSPTREKREAFCAEMSETNRRHHAARGNTGRSRSGRRHRVVRDQRVSAGISGEVARAGHARRDDTRRGARA